MKKTAGAIVGETEGEGEAEVEVEGEVASSGLVASPGTSADEAVGSITSSVGVPEFG
jgi:hypothetical protein